MKRRAFIAGLGSAVAWPTFGKAQGSRQLALVAIQSGIVRSRTRVAFEQGLRELGFIDGQNVESQWRYIQGDVTRVPAIIAELVSLNPNVIVTGATISTVAARRASPTIPIVCPFLTDPIGNGLIISYSHPGQNVTGVLVTLEGLTGKLMELAVELMPHPAMVGVLINANNAAANALQLRDAQVAATALGVELKSVEVHSLDGLDQALQTLEREGARVAIVPNDIAFLGARRAIAEQALALRLPTIFGVREHVEEGGLISYGIDFNDSWRRSGVFVGKILKGAKPGELPVELPTKLEMVINQRTAKALGLIVPPSLLARADEVIE